MEKVQIIPPPKDVDKRVLTWKGASVLGRMEGATDMWVTGVDWVSAELSGNLFKRFLFLFSSRPHLEHVWNAGGERTVLPIVSAKEVEGIDR